MGEGQGIWTRWKITSGYRFLLKYGMSVRPSVKYIDEQKSIQGPPDRVFWIHACIPFETCTLAKFNIC